MTPLSLRREDLPDEFPVFPLAGALLLPHGRLPLNVFEPRYLAMVEDALAGGRLIGMIQPDPQGARRPTGPGLYGLGCLGRLSSFSETEDGRYLITLTGVIRFGVRDEIGMQRGYRRVRAHYADWWADLDEGPQAPIDRNEIAEALRLYFSAQGYEADWAAIGEMPDEALVTTLCMVCPFSPGEKQALLEAPDPAGRARTLIAVLRINGAGGQPSSLPS